MCLEIVAEIGVVALRALLSVIVLFLISKMTGKRQIAQLTFYDYVVGISIGSIAAMAVEQTVPFYDIVVAMLIYGGFTILLAFVTNKSIACRRLITGKPTVMIYKGKIIRKSLTKNNYDLNDLLLECRLRGYFDISQIECAIMENNGEISVLPKPENRPLTPKDMSVKVGKEDITYNLILDGEVMKENLRAYGKDEQWLKNQMKSYKIGSAKEVLLAIGDINDKVTFYKRDETLPHDNFFL